jgi:ring-1,2-phenylacetyl-CoA epoxidase subunit PaaE
MAKFYKLKVADVRKETTDCISVAFNVPLELKSEYKFIQGQYLTLRFFIQGEELRRSYSICSAPFESEMRVAVKKVTGGKVSNFINDHLKPGEEIEVMTPMGSFYSPLHVSHKKKYILFAGGSGITPILSIVKAVLQAEPDSTLMLFYGSLDEESTIFKKQLDALSLENPLRFQLHYIFDKPVQSKGDLYTGVMTKNKVKALLEAHVALDADIEFFICGPTPMMDNVRETLEERKIEKSKIHIEYFLAAALASPKDFVLEKVNSRVTVSLYGNETSFSLSSTGKAILDAALDAGADVPFACKGAVCATCRGKLLEGKVHMDKNFALTEAEIAEGFILTCQSHPLTPVVKVDYDV